MFFSSCYDGPCGEVCNGKERTEQISRPSIRLLLLPIQYRPQPTRIFIVSQRNGILSIFQKVQSLQWLPSWYTAFHQRGSLLLRGFRSRGFQIRTRGWCQWLAERLSRRCGSRCWRVVRGRRVALTAGRLRCGACGDGCCVAEGGCGGEEAHGLRACGRGYLGARGAAQTGSTYHLGRVCGGAFNSALGLLLAKSLRWNRRAAEVFRRFRVALEGILVCRPLCLVLRGTMRAA